MALRLMIVILHDVTHQQYAKTLGITAHSLSLSIYIYMFGVMQELCHQQHHTRFAARWSTRTFSRVPGLSPGFCRGHALKAPKGMPLQHMAHENLETLIWVTTMGVYKAHIHISCVYQP